MNSQATDTSFRERLAPLVTQGIERSRERKQDILVSVTDDLEAIDPIRLFANTVEFATDRWYWEHPDGQLAIATAGVLSATTFPRKIRFSETEYNRRRLMDHAVISPDPGPTHPGPILFSGFTFDPYRMQDRAVWQGFQSSSLLVPRAVLMRSDHRHLLTINVVVGPNRAEKDITEETCQFRDRVLESLAREIPSDDAPVELLEAGRTAQRESSQYLDFVNSAVDSAQRGDFEWVTAARQMMIMTSETFNIVRAIQRLRDGYPEHRIAGAARHGSAFIGMSGDVLASVRGRTLQTTCSLGSIRRGETEDLDDTLADHLRNDESVLERHTLAVNSIADLLNPLSEHVDAPDEPSVRSLGEAHSLHTSVQATLRADISVMDVLKALHPAPALTGYPTDSAYAYLRESEWFDRGWFCAPFGWCDYHGHGEFIAADRAAAVREPLLEQQSAYLFSATPVTSSTDPDQQLDAADTELAPLLASLTE